MKNITYKFISQIYPFELEHGVSNMVPAVPNSAQPSATLLADPP
jgi:hypothetical protein